MKRFLRAVKAVPVMIAACSAFFGCTIPANTRASVATVENSAATDTIPSVDTTSVTDTDEERSKESNSVNVILPEDYVRGFDASYVDYYETDLSLKYYERDGSENDFFEILKNHGVNTVRLRIWVDPENAVDNGIVSDDSSWASSGLNTLERTIRLAKRAKALDMKVLLDFHYSDYWTDPGKQIIPHDWQDITSADEMATKLGTYTTDVLEAMAQENVLPDYVQVGNEIDSGILLHTSYNGSTGTKISADTAVAGTAGSENFVAYLKAGCNAVRQAAPDAKIILHVTNSHPARVLTESISGQLDYDIVGLSFYPWERSHRSISDLRDSVTTFKDYGKDVMVVESSMYWNYSTEWNVTDLSYVAQHMIDPDTDAVYSDLSTVTVSDTVLVEGTIENQAACFRHIIEESVEAGASGIFAWGGDLRGDWKYSFFTYEGTALSSLDVFNVEGK